jgi:hypothetical protein
MGVFMVALIVGAASFAMAGVPDLGLSTATMATVGQTLSLFNLPNGAGAAFTDANAAGGGLADATITVVLNSTSGAIANYPFEDITLSCTDGVNAMVPCLGGVTADANTDAAGMTQFQTPLAAGGWADANTDVMIAGAALTSGSVALKMNSADINGDGIVNLSDVGIFSSIFYGAYSYAADFTNDGLVNLSDVGRLASGVGGACP